MNLPGAVPGTSADGAAPERARWPRLTAIPDPRLRPLLSGGYAGFTEATTPRHLVLPATTAVPPVREFRRFTGTTPTGFQAKVNSVQDASAAAPWPDRDPVARPGSA